MSKSKSFTPVHALIKKKRRVITRHAPGTKPGTILAPKHAETTVINLISYNEKEVIHKNNISVNEIADFIHPHFVTWISVTGLSNTDKIKELGRFFNIHPLALEDVTNVHQRPKTDQYENAEFIVARLDQVTPTVKDEQISFFLGPNYLISFLETPNDIFSKTLTRIENPQSVIRHLGADYLLYELLDTVIDCYFPVLQTYGDAIDELENETIKHPAPNILSNIHKIKHNLVEFKRDVWSLRNALANLYRGENEIIKAKTQVYFRDSYDHTVQIIDIIEGTLDRSSSLVDIYLSSTANRLNEIMKFLTVLSTIFMPMGFLASLWGMNFNTTRSPWNMPELNAYYGYPCALLFMFIISLGLIFYFWRRGWIGKSKK